MSKRYSFNKKFSLHFLLLFAAFCALPIFAANAETTIYFEDDFENILGKWETGGDTWQITDNFSRSGSNCASESPEGDYQSNTNSTMTMRLQERVDLSNSNHPVLTFWHRIGIVEYDYCYVEISDDYGFNWTELKSFTNTHQSTWTLVQIDLSDYKSSNIIIRFRLRDDGSTYSNRRQSWGWDIDDVQIRELDTETTMEFPFFDDFESGLDNWLVGGDAWQLTDQFYRDPNYCVSQSPEDNYISSEYSCLMLAHPIALPDSNHLALTFWQKIGIVDYDYCYVEISDDYGFNWTIIKSFTNIYQSTWNLVQVDLSDYKSENIIIRFRLRDDGSTYSNRRQSWGWDIDDVQIKELDTETIEFPFFDDFESGLDNWLIGVDSWELSGSSWRSPTHSIVDSNDRNYPDRANALLILAHPVDLSSGKFPILSFWHKIGINSGDYCYVEVSKDYGYTWTAIDPNNPDQSRFTNVIYSSWTLELYDLSEYKTTPILIRFRLLADASSNNTGWDIDDIHIRELPIPTLPDELVVQILRIDSSGYPLIKATVLVTDSAGIGIPDLEAYNFCAYENGILQDINSVEPALSNINVGLALDYSGSMSEEALEAMENAAISFVNLMDQQDYGEVIKFANGVEVMQEYTNDKQLLINAIEQQTILDPNATSLYDAIYQAIVDVNDQQGSKAVIAISDGRDLASLHSATEIIKIAKTNDVPVFTIGLGGLIDEEVLETIAIQTGGLYYYAPNPEDLEAIYMSIAVILSNQYIVSYDTKTVESDINYDVENELNVEVITDSAIGHDVKAFNFPLISDPNLVIE